jgi:hypothetical protein
MLVMADSMDGQDTIDGPAFACEFGRLMVTGVVGYRIGQ